MSVPTLWQFRFSHYNEKARWALDCKATPHRRVSLLPGAHLPSMLLRSGQRQVPALEVGGKWIVGSDRIVAFAEETCATPPLLPRDDAERLRALELQRFFDTGLGVALRRLWFYYLIDDAAFLPAQLSIGFGGIEQSMFRAAFPLLRRVFATEMAVHADGAATALPIVMASLDRLEAEIGPSGYLVGDAFSVADLTAAALWTPVAMPPEFPYAFLKPLPEPARAWRESILSRPGLQWVLEMYRRHRGRSAEIA